MTEGEDMINWESLVYDLPEDVLKRKWSGDFEGEIALIDALLASEIPEMLKERLCVERYAAQQLPNEYHISRPQALEMMREWIPDFQESELDALELKRSVEYIYIKGEKYYHRSFRNCLVKVNAGLAARAGKRAPGNNEMVCDVVREIIEKGSLEYEIGLRGTLRIDDSAFLPGRRIRVHLPVPQRCAQQSCIAIGAPGGEISDETSAQRTVFYDRVMTQNEPFCVEYTYKNRIRYVDPLNGPVPASLIYPEAAEPTEDDRAEQAPHIVFSPYLRALAEEIKGGEIDPVKVAWRFYEYVTTKITYSFMRSYSLIENQAEYCALNGKGDCGIQALLFITLCRIAGIPARWQSGLEVDDREAGCHDWAQFYVKPYGWLFCDPSYGGSAWRAGQEINWRFYFGNLDPFRMVANSRYMADFDPPKSYDRVDPYDSQEGEVEFEERGLLPREFHTEYNTLIFRKIED